MKRHPSILFMGTPEFAVPSLRALMDAGFIVKAVVTAVDKPAGRGRQLKMSPVKKLALARHIPVIQPVSLKDPSFIATLNDLSCDLYVVVAFRMLPETVWSLPPMGTVNLHASLLPQYRGAAPINWVLINGEQETGLTTFLIEKEIDTGAILMQEKIALPPSVTAGKLHDLLKHEGAKLLLKTVAGLANKSLRPVRQYIKPGTRLHTAPKLTKELSVIDWTQPAVQIYNLIRGLSPHPGAHTTFITEQEDHFKVKILEAETALLPTERDQSVTAGTCVKIHPKELHFITGSGLLQILQLQPEGKKPMTTAAFINGFRGKILKAV